MKEKILSIASDLRDSRITSYQAKDLLLGLFGIRGSLLSDEEIREAADEWVFDKNGMKWSNNDNTTGDNYGSFISGVKWALSRLCNYR